MSKIARYTGNLRAFGSNAQGLERTLFGETNQADDLTSQVTAAFLRGWGIVGPSENPSMEDFNAAMYTMSQFIAYQHQMGVPEWDAAQEYYIGSLCVRAGETYASIVNSNINSAPPSAKWTQLITVKNGLTSLGLADASGYVGRLIKTQTFAAAGTFTYTRTPGAKKARVYVTGAGGSGARGSSTTAPPGGGGGAGGTAIKMITLTQDTYTVVVGARALGGSPGGSSSFGTECAASGGGFATGGGGGAPGVGSGGDINLSGGYGSDATDSSLGGYGSGDGGASYWGGGRKAGTGTGQSDYGAPGSGGGGNQAANTAGQNMGAPGIVYIEEYS